MENTINILSVILPLIIFGIIIIYIIKSFLQNESKQRIQAQLLETRKVLIPLKFQAYERLSLFLERITPENILIRINKPGISAKELHLMCINSIKQEFEHNLSQQVYVNYDTWMVIRKAKSEIEKLINETAKELKKDDNAMTFSTELLTSFVSLQINPIESAQRKLKQEIELHF